MACSAQIVDLFQNWETTSSDWDKYFVSRVANRILKSTHVAASTYPCNQFHELNTSSQLQDPTTAFQSYTGNVFLPDGKVEVNAEYQGRTSGEEP
jgi:hypothetical protein